ncbi:nucleotide sugar dehydrogenase [Mangrovibacterium lignilyticum]|uniref:nucleotide sugar dehydrogenase n=1 Tax=Mangrovibacterium lignilyticum TaxID=2668052 RepID=UPI0013D836C6|nr:nucleotide sugar dehydrogenase [Mangrovibacterium lignilyticum]
MSLKNDILQKIAASEEQIGVIGLGEIGLRLAVAFASAGISVIGFEKSAERITKVNAGQNYIQDLNNEDFSRLIRTEKLRASANFSELSACDAIFICVPTPLDVFKKPDMSHIRDSCEAIADNLKKGTFICLESTTYPTTTEDFILPLVEEKSKLKHGEDFWLAFSPERVDPGNAEFLTRNTPKVIGALTDDGLEIGQAIYKKIIDAVHPVSSPRVAEMVKILENTYRLVNISLINEMALLCGKMDINIWEVIEAAKTKPYGFQTFYPGPGIGGHCIPLDPFYLEYIARKFNFDLSLINTAGHINNMMAHRMTIKVTSALNQHKKAINGSNILFLGVAYKPNIDDYRESPALKIMEEVIKKGGNILYHDPFIPKIETPSGQLFSSREISMELLQNADCVVICTNHDAFDPSFILNNSLLIVDLRNAIQEPSEKVYKL